MRDDSSIEKLIEVSRRVRILCSQRAYIYAKRDLPGAVSSMDIEAIVNSGCAIQCTQTEEPKVWRWVGYNIDGLLVGFAFSFRATDDGKEFFYFTKVSLLPSPKKIPNFEAIFNQVIQCL